MPSHRIPIYDEYCSQVSVGKQNGKDRLYETTFDLANSSNLRVKLVSILKSFYGDMRFEFEDNVTEKMMYTLWTEPDQPIVKYGDDLVTFDFVAGREGTLSGEVDVYINGINVNIVTADNVPQSNVTIGNVKVHIKDNLTLH